MSRPRQGGFLRYDPPGERARSLRLCGQQRPSGPDRDVQIHGFGVRDAGAPSAGSVLSSERGPRPAIHAERLIGVAAISRLLSELRRKSVHVHLVVLVVRPWSDRAFNHLTHSVDRFAFPDADAEAVIVGSRMDWQRHVGRKPSFECLGLGGLKAFGVVNSVDDCHKHGSTVRSSG